MRMPGPLVAVTVAISTKCLAVRRLLTLVDGTAVGTATEREAHDGPFVYSTRSRSEQVTVVTT